MKIFKILILLNFCLLLFSCNTVKKGFTNQKKSSTDEFLVEKKSPLVQPPDYNELPIPSEGENLIVNEEQKVKKLISQQDQQNDNNSLEESVDESFENSLLKKIKQN